VLRRHVHDGHLSPSSTRARRAIALAALAAAALAGGCRHHARPAAPARLAAPAAAARLGIVAYAVLEASPRHVEARLFDAAGDAGALRIDAGERAIAQRWERGEERTTVVVDAASIRWSGTLEGSLARTGGAFRGEVPPEARPFFAALAAFDTELAVQGTALVGDPEHPTYSPCTARGLAATRCFADPTTPAAACADAFARCAQCLRTSP
jgi:hypothetical protein